MDIYLDIDNDIPATAAGDFDITTGSVLTKQRILRRLLTNPGSYIWHPDYGAGLGQFVGKPMSPSTVDEITGRIRSQMFKENAVSKTKPPEISVSQDSTNPNNLVIYILYYDANLNVPFTLTFTIGN
jgi:hypothetical protein